jgi:hypothetical protein
MHTENLVKILILSTRTMAMQGYENLQESRRVYPRG